jgi:Ca-activated chloride channel family protein
MTSHIISIRILAMLVVVGLVVAACDDSFGESEPLDQSTAEQRVAELVDRIDWSDALVARKANVAPPRKELSDTLPAITEFELSADPGAGIDQVVAEIFVSTEKSGDGDDGWMADAARSFNGSNQLVADGRDAKVAIRRIASGTGFQFIAAGDHLPAGFSPSNHLWVQMANEYEPVSVVREQTVPNVAGIVMKDETASRLREEYGELDARTLIDAVVAGELVMGYTNPFASSTGLNFLLTVLDEFADGDEARLVDPDVASVFEEFQEQVPFVAFTTLQMRESVENDNGTLDAFVMEWQTFVNSDSLRSGFEFIPFGIRHDNPLYELDGASIEEKEVLELFASHLESQQVQDRARDMGFDPPAYDSDVILPSGSTLIAAQSLWKDKKDAGRPVYAVFVSDTSGSMQGSRILAVKQALASAREFIDPEASIGMVEFSDTARKVLDIGAFDLNQQAGFAAAAEDMDPAGGTAMYDGIMLGLSMLIEQRELDPGGKFALVVLTDGETTAGLNFNEVDEAIVGTGIPVFSVGFEADLDELARLSSLVEAASINASEGDVEFKLASLFNAGV